MTADVMDRQDDRLIDGIVLDGRTVRFGDFVQVLPSAPGRRDGFTGKVKGWWITDDGEITALDVWGGKPQHEMMRSIRPTRVILFTDRRQGALQRAAGKKEIN
jgi:hypothetical protein